MKSSVFGVIDSMESLIRLIGQVGFVPAFRNHIPGFSVEDAIDPRFWFSAEGDGFWEWKGPVIQQSGCAYGKFLAGRAAFMTPELYYEFANYRRDGYDFDARYDDGLARFRDKQVFDILWQHGSLLSKDLSRKLPEGEGRKNFYTVMTELQMLGYVVISDFEYMTNKKGVPYGWGITRYQTPELRFGDDFSQKVYAHTPQQSKQILFEHLRKLLPDCDEKAILKIIG